MIVKKDVEKIIVDFENVLVMLKEVDMPVNSNWNIKTEGVEPYNLVIENANFVGAHEFIFGSYWKIKGEEFYYIGIANSNPNKHQLYNIKSKYTIILTLKQ